MIYWKQKKVYMPTEIAKHLNFIKKNMDLMPICKDEKTKLIKYAKNNNINPRELLFLRNTLKTQFEINQTKYLYNQQERIISWFNLKFDKDTIDYNDVYNFLRETRMPINGVLKIITKTPKYKKFSNKNKQCFEKIIKHNAKNNSKIRIRSSYFERCLEEYLKNFNIKFRTEIEIKESGDYTLTPDILFDIPIVIIVNGKKYSINWLDAKDYCLVKIPFIMSSLQKQAYKYNNMFGKGGFVFHYGFDASIKIKDTLILDGSSI